MNYNYCCIHKQRTHEKTFVFSHALPVVICHLEAGERMITERGSMAWMSPNMKMETSTNGGFGKAFGRMFSGEAMFQNIYTAEGSEAMIAFGSSFPGKDRKSVV